MTQRATVRVAIAPLMAAPRAASGQVSQLIRGHSADLLDTEGDWRRIRGSDGYDGWCHRGYLSSDAAEQTPSSGSAWVSELRMSLGCTVRRPDGQDLALPLGAILDAGETVLTGLAMNNRARARYFAAEPDNLVVRAAELFRGAYYQWGGVTPWGCDCSGFVQTVYALHGVQLPRDAWMQAETGREAGSEAGSDAGDLHAADLLFFSDSEDGRITHVAISLGGPALIHLSLANGGFGIDSLVADDPVGQGLRRNFRFGRRIL